MIYELRVYTALPGRMPNLLARFKDHTVLAKAWDRSHWILDNLEWPLYQRADLHSPLEFPR